MATEDSTTLDTGPPNNREEENTEYDMSNLVEVGETSRSNGADLTKGEIFDLLKNSRRRGIVVYLLEHDGYAELKHVAEHIAAEENDITVRELSSDQRKRVYIGLYQCHLPKMDDLGVVDYDKNRGTIELQDSVAHLLPYMDVGDDDENEPTTRSWTIPTVAACVVALVTLGTLGVGVFSAVPAVGWTVLSIVGIFVIVGLQYRE